MKHTKLIERVTDYGAIQEVLKHGNKILGWIEQYSSNSANTQEIGKWFFAIGKPSQKYPIQYVCNTLDEAEHKLCEAVNNTYFRPTKHQEDVLEDESLANEAFDDRGDYYG